jgi:hypothetical protein
LDTTQRQGKRATEEANADDHDEESQRRGERREDEEAQERGALLAWWWCVHFLSCDTRAIGLTSEGTEEL